ncbi:hypothetical protein N7535_004057 [Penicillium sp. DV-2018c]|nr:hypothetical protein N7535_004057 [Penicillium sp. DV-2018c]
MSRISQSENNGEVLECVRALEMLFLADFILVGGAATILEGHDRVTADVDILIRSQTVFDSLRSVDGFEVLAGRLSYRTVIVDLLTAINDRFTYNKVEGYVRYVHGLLYCNPTSP